MILHAMLRDHFSFYIDHNKEAVMLILEDELNFEAVYWENILG